MRPVNTTIVAVVSAHDPGRALPLQGVRAANVRVVRPPDDDGVLDRAREAWAQAQRTAVTYLLHDADPLAEVAAQWVARFDGRGVVGDLEIAVADVVARWRAGSIELPDYYLVVDAEALAPTARHWFFGVLAHHVPARVVATRPGTDIVDHLPDLHHGPWWPALDRLLAGIEDVVPDQAGRLTGPVAGELRPRAS